LAWSYRELGQRRRPRILGVGIRLDNALRDIRRHGYSSSAALLVPADDHDVVDNDNHRFYFILMCYGGGFGTMPALTADCFGPKNVGRERLTIDDRRRTPELESA
jgi:hypothetical protein